MPNVAVITIPPRQYLSYNATAGSACSLPAPLDPQRIGVNLVDLVNIGSGTTEFSALGAASVPPFEGTIPYFTTVLNDWGLYGGTVTPELINNRIQIYMEFGALPTSAWATVEGVTQIPAGATLSTVDADRQLIMDLRVGDWVAARRGLGTAEVQLVAGTISGSGTIANAIGTVTCPTYGGGQAILAVINGAAATAQYGAPFLTDDIAEFTTYAGPGVHYPYFTCRLLEVCNKVNITESNTTVTPPDPTATFIPGAVYDVSWTREHRVADAVVYSPLGQKAALTNTRLGWSDRAMLLVGQRHTIVATNDPVTFKHDVEYRFRRFPYTSPSGASNYITISSDDASDSFSFIDAAIWPEA